MWRRLDGPQGRSGRVWRGENLLSPQGFEHRTVQPTEISNPSVGQKIFTSPHPFQTGPGAHPASCTFDMGGGAFLGIKWQMQVLNKYNFR